MSDGKLQVQQLEQSSESSSDSNVSTALEAKDDVDKFHTSKQHEHYYIDYQQLFNKRFDEMTIPVIPDDFMPGVYQVGNGTSMDPEQQQNTFDILKVKHKDPIRKFVRDHNIIGNRSTRGVPTNSGKKKQHYIHKKKEDLMTTSYRIVARKMKFKKQRKSHNITLGEIIDLYDTYDQAFKYELDAISEAGIDFIEKRLKFKKAD